MAAGLAPPTHIFRFVMALLVAFAIAVVPPASSTLANVNPAVATDDDDGGKKKKNRDKKSDDDDDEDSDEHKGKKSDDDEDSDSDDEDSDSDDDDSDSDDDDSDSDDDDSDSDDADDDSAASDSGSVLARKSDDPSPGSADPVQSADPAATRDAAAPVTPAAAASLVANGGYMSMPDAIAHARKAGAKGDVLQIDLEFDAFRGFATCDVTFSSGTEYEMNAQTGELLGEKQKDPRKLALLTPLATDAKSLKAFTDIIAQVSKATGQAVLEMELKHPKGQPGVIFEVVTADGMTSHFDAATGQPAAGV